MGGQHSTRLDANEKAFVESNTALGDTEATKIKYEFSREGCTPADYADTYSAMGVNDRLADSMGSALCSSMGPRYDADTDKVPDLELFDAFKICSAALGPSSASTIVLWRDAARKPNSARTDAEVLAAAHAASTDFLFRYIRAMNNVLHPNEESTVIITNPSDDANVPRDSRDGEPLIDAVNRELSFIFVEDLVAVLDALQSTREKFEGGFFLFRWFRFLTRSNKPETVFEPNSGLELYAYIANTIATAPENNTGQLPKVSPNQRDQRLNGNHHKISWKVWKDNLHATSDVVAHLFTNSNDVAFRAVKTRKRVPHKKDEYHEMHRVKKDVYSHV